MDEVNRAPLTPDEIEQRMGPIGVAMKHRAFGHTSALYGVFDDEFGELVGSGTFVRFLGETFLLTALHVAERDGFTELDGTRRYRCLARSVQSGLPPVQLSASERIGWDHPLDLCVYPVDGATLGDRIALEIGELALDATLAERDLLFVQGFPQEQSKALFGVHSTTYPYVTTAGECTKFDWYDPKIHIAVDFASSGLKDEMGKSVPPIDPHGMSGSAVWTTGRTLTGDDWTADRAKVVGVVHNWDDRAGSLIATRVEVVRDLLLHAVRRLQAHRRWERRGSPDADDWADWFATVDAVPLRDEPA